MARPRKDDTIHPIARRPGAAHVRLARARPGINESAYARIDRILRENMSLTDSVGYMFGNAQAARRSLVDGDIYQVLSRVVDSVAEGLAILACYDKP